MGMETPIGTAKKLTAASSERYPMGIGDAYKLRADYQVLNPVGEIPNGNGNESADASSGVSLNVDKIPNGNWRPLEPAFKGTPLLESERYPMGIGDLLSSIYSSEESSGRRDTQWDVRGG